MTWWLILPSLAHIIWMSRVWVLRQLFFFPQKKIILIILEIISIELSQPLCAVSVLFLTFDSSHYFNFLNLLFTWSMTPSSALQLILHFDTNREASKTDIVSTVVCVNGKLRWTAVVHTYQELPTTMRRTRRWALHHYAEMFSKLLVCAVIATKIHQMRPGLAHIKKYSTGNEVRVSLKQK